MLRLFRLLLFFSSVFARKTPFLDKHRRASDVIIDLISRSGLENDLESQQFRQMIATHQSANPLKLLHYLAPKIPAIRHSPDIALQIRAAKTDMDCGIAACVIAALGRACEVQDEYVDDILNDRRFEQLIECVMCGVDHKAEYTEGLSIRDACRAAWGIAVLTANRKSGNNNLGQVLEALSARVIHVLSHRQELLKRGDMVQDGIETVQAGLELFSEELAEDAASVLWTFACVKVCTGQNVTSLGNLCASLLVQDPFATRKLAQEGSLSGIAADSNLEIGANDVVERLAQSEVGTETTAKEMPTTEDTGTVVEDSSVSIDSTPATSVSEKSYVLDWLSPNELIDSLWAIALHGAKLDNVSSDIDLFCEKALQTMAEFVQMELQRLKIEYETEGKDSTDVIFDVDDVDPENTILGENTEIVDHPLIGHEVADLPGSDLSGAILNANEDFRPYSEEQVPRSPDNLDDHESIPLRVTDAFELINAEKLRDGGAETLVGQEDEWASAILGGVLDFDENGLEASSEGETGGVVSHHEPSLSQRDLCSLAWAVTELDGSHREVILHDIANIFRTMGANSVTGLSGPDLSNLCWSVAKSNFAIQDDVSDIVVKWIADRAIEISSPDDMSNDSSALLRCLSPHELGRLVWSLSTILLDQGTVRWTSVSIVSLTYRSLITAGSHLALFSSEDMARVIWAFLSLTDTSVSFGWPNVSQALGKLLATIETSLLEWENGRELERVDTEIHEDRDASKVASFLGRSRFALRFFDQRIENSLGDSYDAQEVSKTSNRLPLLRDLPVDPLSLCKLSSAISKLAHQFDKSLIQSGVLTRISLRLFVSHDGRLLRECPLPDLVRLAEATALSMEVAALRALTGQFTRKALHIINEMPSDESGVIWLDLGPDDLSGLIWSLGELGATYCGTDSDRLTAHRRLHIAVKPYFPLHSLESFSVSKTIRMLNGLVSTQLVAQMMDQVAQILRHLEQRLNVTEEGLNVCILLTILASLRRDIVEGDLFIENDLENQIGNMTKPLDDLGGDVEEFTTLASSVSPNTLLELCDRVLLSLTVSIAGTLPRTSTSDLLKILSVIIRDRLQYDELVRAIGACVEDRAKDIDTERRAPSTISAASSTLRSLLQTYNSDSEESSLLGTERLESTVAALDELHRAVGNPRVSRKPGLDAIELELCWARELIEQYNRLDFKSGSSSLQSGLDQNRRRKMAKRALSRLLPVPSQKLP